MVYDLSLLFGIGIVIASVLYFAFKLDSVHIFWKTLTAIFLFSLLILIPKALIDQETTCNYYPANETITGNITLISYSQLCLTETHNTSNLLLGIVLWLQRLFFVYIFLYLNYEWWIKKKLYTIGIIKKTNVKK